MGRVLKIIFNTILILLIIVLSCYCVLRFTDKVRIYNVETGSMEDKIHTGDYILLIKKSNYYVGDVVTYNVKGYFITHRIVKIENGLVITKGDANNTEDEGINIDQIEGKVIYCGGVLNFVINYKFVIAAFLVGLYLLSCYFGDGSEETISDNFLTDDDSNKYANEIEHGDEKDVIKEETEENIEIIDDVDESNNIEEQKNEELEEIKEEVEKPKRTRKPKKEKIEDTIQEEKIEEVKEVKKVKKTTKETKTKKTSKTNKK